MANRVEVLRAIQRTAQILAGLARRQGNDDWAATLDRRVRRCLRLRNRLVERGF